MEHLRYDLSNLKKGSTVVVTLNNQANVQLMTPTEYNSYRAGRRYRYHGGRVTRSPFRITVPSTGHWVVAVDLGGYAGRIAASVAVQPPPRGFLPPARSVQDNPASVVAVRDDPAEPEGDLLGGQTWDVFISHASEDMDSVARPLRDALTHLGVAVWLDEAQMRIGTACGVRSTKAFARAASGLWSSPKRSSARGGPTTSSTAS